METKYCIYDCYYETIAESDGNVYDTLEEALDSFNGRSVEDIFFADQQFIICEMKPVKRILPPEIAFKVENTETFTF